MSKAAKRTKEKFRRATSPTRHRSLLHRVAAISVVLPRALLSVVAAISGVFVLATAASAHDNAVTGVVSCVTTPTTSNYSIKWTIANDYNLTETATVTSVTPGGLSAVSPISVNIAKSPDTSHESTGTVTETLPSTDTGSANIYVNGVWSDNYSTSDEGVVRLSGSCLSPSQLSTTPSASAVLVGQPIHDVATLTEGNATAPTGSVHFYACGPNQSPTNCPTTPTSLATYADLGTATVSSNSATSANFTPSSSGTFCFVAIYSGDRHYLSETDNATNECFVVEHPAITLLKKTNGTAGAAGNITVGATVTWSYIVTNSGDVALSNVTVTDNRLAASAINCGSGSNVIASLAVGAPAVTCTATGVAVAGAYSNTGSVIATPPLGPTVSATSSSSYFGASSSLSLVKSDNLNPAKYSTVGQHVTYSYVVTNSGNVTLSGPITVADNKVTVTCPATSSLAPGSSVDCSATYVSAPVSSAQASDTIHANQTSSLSLVKSANTSLTESTSSTYNHVGQVVTYSYLVRNTGNVTLTGPISVSDNKLGAIACPSGSLSPGASITCTATYKVTQADLDAGSVRNTATAQSNGTSSNLSTVTITAIQKAGLGLTKAASVGGSPAPPGTYDSLGQVVTYTYVVTNTGNDTLSGPITITDNKLGTISCPSGSLDPGASITCAATYKVTQADLDFGSITNVAAAHSSGVTSNTATVTVTAVQRMGLSLVKTAKIDGNPSPPATFTAVGQIVVYTYVVTNTGNVTIPGPITVTDNKLPKVDCPTGNLAPGTSMTCTASYKITAADLAGGSITNVAVAHGGGVDSNANVPSAAATVRPGLPPAVSGKHATAPTTAPAAKATPVPQATTIHTGEPWIGAGPWITFLFGLGAMLLGLGTLLRRRAGARR